MPPRVTCGTGSRLTWPGSLPPPVTAGRRCGCESERALGRGRAAATPCPQGTELRPPHLEASGRSLLPAPPRPCGLPRPTLPVIRKLGKQEPSSQGTVRQGRGAPAVEDTAAARGSGTGASCLPRTRSSKMDAGRGGIARGCGEQSAPRAASGQPGRRATFSWGAGQVAGKRCGVRRAAVWLAVSDLVTHFPSSSWAAPGLPQGLDVCVTPGVAARDLLSTLRARTHWTMAWPQRPQLPGGDRGLDSATVPLAPGAGATVTRRHLSWCVTWSCHTL